MTGGIINPMRKNFDWEFSLKEHVKICCKSQGMIRSGAMVLGKRLVSDAYLVFLIFIRDNCHPLCSQPIIVHELLACLLIRPQPNTNEAQISSSWKEIASFEKTWL